MLVGFLVVLGGNQLMLCSMYSALSFDIEQFRERLHLNRVSIFILATSSCFMVIGVGIVSAILVL